jgi:beta-alanine--pyruvate transaminase
MATLDIYEQEGLFERPKALQDPWQDAALGLSDLPNVIDVRCFALLGAIELAPLDGAPMQRGAAVAKRCYEKGAWVRPIGDSLVLSPPLIISEAEIKRIFDIIGEAICEVG